MEKPLDTQEHCLLRRDWVIDHHGLLTSIYSPVTFIDEKWFYRVNRRCKMKILPKGKAEKEECEYTKKQRYYLDTSLARRCLWP